MSGNISGHEPTERQSVLTLPRLPVLGWESFTGPKYSAIPCILDVPDVRFTTSGRAAIELALRTLGVGHGDGVLVPTYHCPTMIAPVVAVGAEPIFFPIDDSGAPAIGALDAVDISRVRAMVAAHYFGIPQPMGALRAFCDQRGIALIEDCAHSLFGISEGRAVGQWGDYAIASLTKFLPVSDGGCLVSSHGLGNVSQLRRQPLVMQAKSLANALELGARHNRIRGFNVLLTRAFRLMKTFRPEGAPALAAEVRHDAGNQTRDWLRDFIPESMLGCMATSWTQWCARHVHRERITLIRRRNYAHLTHLVARIPGVRPLRPDLPDGAVPYVFPLWVDRPEAVYKAVRAAGIPVFRWDDLWPTRPLLANDSGKEWATHIFQLGCHQDLRPDDLIRIADTMAAISTRRSVRTDKATAEV